MAITLKPDDPNVHGAKACILDELGRYNEALDSYDKVIKLMPDNALAYESKGYTLDKLGEIIKNSK